MITDVKIFDTDNFTTLFETASPIKINIRDERKSTTFQVESGETRSDHIVVQAVEIGMELILSGELKNAFGLMQQVWEQNTLVGIQTRVKTYQPMLLVNFYHDETAEMADAVQLSLRFTEWRTVTPEYGDLPARKVQKPSQSSTVKRGGAQTKSVSEERKKSVLVRVLGG